MCGGDPCGYHIPRLLGDLELHCSLCFLLHDNRAAGDMTALDYIVDAQRDQITPAQFAVDGKVEQCEFSGSMIQLQPNPDSPDLLQPQRWLLAEQLAFVPRRNAPSGLRRRIHESLLCWVKRVSCWSRPTGASRPSADARGIGSGVSRIPSQRLVKIEPGRARSADYLVSRPGATTFHPRWKIVASRPRDSDATCCCPRASKTHAPKMHSQPRRAASIAAMSIFFICIIASNARL